MDPDPAIFVIELQDASKKLIFLHKFFCLILFDGTFTSFFKDKKSKNSRNQGFSYYFCLIEISGFGSIPLTSGSESGRPKNMWIRIRISNTVFSVADPGSDAFLTPGSGMGRILESQHPDPDPG
jgi:hypothetical protein